MSRAKRQIILRRRRIVQRNRRIVAACTLALMALNVSILFHNFSVQAERPAAGYKYYTDVRVERGDSLWSIAEQYITEEYKSMDSYIREIKKINHLGNDLQCGQIIVVPYYSDVVK